MRTLYLILGITLLMLTGAVVTAEAKTLRTHCKGGGTFTDGVETNIDTNGDGASATLGQGAEVCNFGNFVYQEEVEWIPRPVTSACPTGTTLEFYIDATHGQHSAVATDEESGDQLFGRTISGIECLNTSKFPYTLSGVVRQKVIGGTGQYTGATGTGNARFAGSYLAAGCKKGVCPPEPGGVFGGFGQYTFTSNGTLTLPRGGHD